MAGCVYHEWRAQRCILADCFLLSVRGLTLYLGLFYSACAVILALFWCVLLLHSGTAYYLAKEVFDGNGYGKPVDLWAVGIVLFVILSGRFCFYGDTDERFMRRLRAGVRFPESEWSTISEGARSLIRGLLRPDPATRLTASQALRHPWLQPARDRAGDPTPVAPSLAGSTGISGGGCSGSGGVSGGSGGGGDGAGSGGGLPLPPLPIPPEFEVDTLAAPLPQPVGIAVSNLPAHDDRLLMEEDDRASGGDGSDADGVASDAGSDGGGDDSDDHGASGQNDDEAASVPAGDAPAAAAAPCRPLTRGMAALERAEAVEAASNRAAKAAWKAKPNNRAAMAAARDAVRRLAAPPNGQPVVAKLLQAARLRVRQLNNQKSAAASRASQKALVMALRQELQQL